MKKSVLIFSVVMFWSFTIFGYEALINSNLMFGTGSENSVNTKGTLQQPWYNKDSTWYKLTYSNYPLDYAIGIGGGWYE